MDESKNNDSDDGKPPAANDWVPSFSDDEDNTILAPVPLDPPISSVKNKKYSVDDMNKVLGTPAGSGTDTVGGSVRSTAPRSTPYSFSIAPSTQYSFVSPSSGRKKQKVLSDDGKVEGGVAVTWKPFKKPVIDLTEDEHGISPQWETWTNETSNERPIDLTGNPPNEVTNNVRATSNQHANQTDEFVNEVTNNFHSNNDEAVQGVASLPANNHSNPPSFFDNVMARLPAAGSSATVARPKSNKGTTSEGWESELAKELALARTLEAGSEQSPSRFVFHPDRDLYLAVADAIKKATSDQSPEIAGRSLLNGRGWSLLLTDPRIDGLPFGDRSLANFTPRIGGNGGDNRITLFRDMIDRAANGAPPGSPRHAEATAQANQLSFSMVEFYLWNMNEAPGLKHTRKKCQPPKALDYCKCVIPILFSVDHPMHYSPSMVNRYRRFAPLNNQSAEWYPEHLKGRVLSFVDTDWEGLEQMYKAWLLLNLRCTPSTRIRNGNTEYSSLSVAEMNVTLFRKLALFQRQVNARTRTPDYTTQSYRRSRERALLALREIGTGRLDGWMQIE